MAIMKRWIFLVLLAMPLHAQTAVTLWLSSQQNGGGDSFPSSRPDATIEFANGSGYGVSVSRMFGARLSGELALFRTSSDGTLRDNGIAFVSLGDVELTPKETKAKTEEHTSELQSLAYLVCRLLLEKKKKKNKKHK